MYEEAYNDYLKDRERGNGTLITFHSTVSNLTSSLKSLPFKDHSLARFSLITWIKDQNTLGEMKP